MVFFDRIDQNVSKYKIVIRMKKWWWSLFGGGNILKYSKEGRPSSSHVGIQSVRSDVCHEVAHYEVPSKKQGMCKVCKSNF